MLASIIRRFLKCLFCCMKKMKLRSASDRSRTLEIMLGLPKAAPMIRLVRIPFALVLSCCVLLSGHRIPPVVGYAITPGVPPFRSVAPSSVFRRIGRLYGFILCSAFWSVALCIPPVGRLCSFYVGAPPFGRLHNFANVFPL